jgi:uncharacterized protein YdaT
MTLPGEKEGKVNKAQHVSPRSDGRWSVRSTGSPRASKLFDTRQEAYEHAERIAEKGMTDLFVHASDGSVRDWKSFAKPASADGD